MRTAKLSLLPDLMGNVKVEEVDGFGGSFMEMLVKVDDDHAGYDGRRRMEKAEEKGFVFFPPKHLLSASSSSEVQMLCFGGVGGGEYEECCGLLLDFLPPSPSDCSLSASTPSIENREPMTQREAMPAIGRGNGRRGNFGGVSGCSRSKRAKAEASPASGSARAGKAKLGAHIKALQQLVPPMAKSDAASVLHEALGYIRFLLGQVQALSSAYVQVKESESAAATAVAEEEERLALSLKRRGLCLVPLSATEQIAASCAEICAPTPTSK